MAKGCGPGKWGDKLVPDSPLGLYLHDACKQHDLSYENPQGKSRFDCDVEFLINMLNTAREYSGKERRKLMYHICLLYYYAVRLFGWISWWKCRLK